MLGLVAGAGQLPVAVAAGAGKALYVVRLKGLADDTLARYPGGEFGLGQLGGVVEAFRKADVRRVVFAGKVDRPDFSTLKLDWRAARALPRILAAAPRGDDALMRAVLAEFEREGFEIVGVEQVLDALLAAPGPLGSQGPDAAAMTDIATAQRAAQAIGDLDIGQAAVACGGIVLAVEAQEGTDQMLARVASLPARLRGTAETRRGVLVKTPKPGQDRRIDLPTIGLETLNGASLAGLAGIAVSAGGALIVDKKAMTAAADEAGMFIYGIPQE